jgi:hypothetical protein
MRQKLRRAGLSVLCGVVLSAAYNAIALLLIDPYAQGTLAHVLLAPGMLLAGPGFEAQMAGLPFNVAVFFVLFSVLTWVLLKRRADRLSGVNRTKDGWWPSAKS